MADTMCVPSRRYHVRCVLCSSSSEIAVSPPCLACRSSSSRCDIASACCTQHVTSRHNALCGAPCACTSTLNGLNDPYPMTGITCAPTSALQGWLLIMHPMHIAALTLKHKLPASTHHHHRHHHWLLLVAHSHCSCQLAWSKWSPLWCRCGSTCE